MGEGEICEWGSNARMRRKVESKGRDPSSLRRRKRRTIFIFPCGGGTRDSFAVCLKRGRGEGEGNFTWSGGIERDETKGGNKKKENRGGIHEEFSRAGSVVGREKEKVERRGDMSVTVAIPPR